MKTDKTKKDQSRNPKRRDFWNNRTLSEYEDVRCYRKEGKSSRRLLSIASKPRKTQRWFIKRDPKDSGFGNERLYTEVVAQEFRRMIQGNAQPKTRVVFHTDDEQNIVYKWVASKEVLGFLSLSKFNLGPNLESIDRFMGDLSISIALSIFLGECDLHIENIGINRDGKLCVIDGDCALLGVFRADYAQLTKISLALLNNPFDLGKDYSPYNWLDVVVGNYIDEECKQEWEEIISSPRSIFYDCFYGVLLLLICLPKDFFTRFCQRYAYGATENSASNIIQKTADYLLGRQQQLAENIHYVSRFRQYILQEDYLDILKVQITAITDFIPKGKETLLPANEIGRFKKQVLTSCFKVHAECNMHSSANNNGPYRT